MSLPILTAVTGAAWEARLLAALDRGGTSLVVVRRCVDLADLLAAAGAGQGRAVLLSADLRRLDREALERLAAAGVAVVGVVTPRDEDAERRLRQLGVGRVVPADSSVDEVALAVHEEVDRVRRGAGGRGMAEPAASGAGLGHGEGADLWHRLTGAGVGATDAATPPGNGSGGGRLVAVWGPTGAPGRTSVAIILAAGAARLGRATLLADADTYGGAVAQVLGLLDEAPGLAAAARAANHGRLDLAGLAGQARQVTPHLRVLTGIIRPDRWPELRPASLEAVWALARGLAEVTVVDCGFSLEQDEEISFDTAAPRRNGATLVTIQQADTVVAVGSAEPVGLQRLVRELATLRDIVPGADVRVVVNRIRRAVVGPHPERQIRDALERYAGVQGAILVPDDRPAFDQALVLGRMLVESAPSSAALAALAPLAAELAGHPPAPTGRRRRHAVRG